MVRIVLISFILIGLSQQHVHAYNTDKTPIFDGTAHQLNKNDWRLGVFQLDYGITDWLQVGTVHLAWLVSLNNLNAKIKIYGTGKHLFSTQIGYYQVDAQRIDEDNPDIVFYVVPWALSWSRRGKDSTWSVNLLFSRTGLRGESSEDSELELGGALVATSGIVSPVYEYRFSKVSALILEANISMFQRIDGNASTTIRIDERTTINAYGNADVSFNDEFLANATASMLWSWSSFNLKVGLGYGHISLPLVNFFLPNMRTVIPQFNLFWVF